jgi:hypothetical protein
VRQSNLENVKVNYFLNTHSAERMKLLLSEEQLRTQVRYFAYYQMVGGILATGLVVLALAHVETLSGILLLGYTGLLSLTGFVIYCGYLTLKQPVRGLELSRISLLIQFFRFTIGGFSFRFSAGPLLALGVDLTKSTLFKFDAAIAELSLKLDTTASSDILLLSVNVVAMLLFFRTTFWLNEWHARYSGEKA